MLDGCKLTIGIKDQLIFILRKPDFLCWNLASSWSSSSSSSGKASQADVEGKSQFGSRNNECGTFGSNPSIDFNWNLDFLWSNLAGASSDLPAKDHLGPSAESNPKKQAVAEYARQILFEW
jgi:hypothetical protein